MTANLMENNCETAENWWEDRLEVEDEQRLQQMMEEYKQKLIVEHPEMNQRARFLRANIMKYRYKEKIIREYQLYKDLNDEEKQRLQQMGLEYRIRMIINNPDYVKRDSRDEEDRYDDGALDIEFYFRNKIIRERDGKEEEKIEEDEEIEINEEIRNYIKQQEIDKAREQRLLVRALKLGFKP
jgi:hypothetical protein